MNILKEKLLTALNQAQVPNKTLSNIVEAIALLLIDIGVTGLNQQGNNQAPITVTKEYLQELQKRHNTLPLLASALVLQGAAMLGWIQDESLVSSTLIQQGGKQHD